MITTRRELNKEKIRRSILKASRKLFSTKGYEDTMMEDIAVTAEVSKATIYNYFPNKESLLIGTADEVLDKIKMLLDSNEHLSTSSLEKIRLVLKELVISSSEYLELSRRITYLNSCEGSPMYKTRQEMVNIFKSLVLSAQEEGDLKNTVSVDDIVDGIMGIYLIALFEWPHLDRIPQPFLLEKLNRTFDEMLWFYFQK